MVSNSKPRRTFPASSTASLRHTSQTRASAHSKARASARSQTRVSARSSIYGSSRISRKGANTVYRASAASFRAAGRTRSNSYSSMGTSSPSSDPRASTAAYQRKYGQDFSDGVDVRNVKPTGRTSRTPDDLRSVRVSSLRSQARYSRRRGFRFVPIVLALVLVFVLVFGIAAFLLADSEMFSIEEISVTGVEHVSYDELTELAAVPQGATLLNVDANGISSRLCENPWVQSVTLERVFPHTLKLNVSERSISAMVEVMVDNSQTTQCWVLALDGMWLAEIPENIDKEASAVERKIYEDAQAALNIIDIPYGSTPEAGSYCSNANIENALAIIEGMSTELADQVKSVSAASSDSTTLTLADGVEIVFGDSSDIRDKERVCLELLEEYPDQISYINVRTVNNPTWRML